MVFAQNLAYLRRMHRRMTQEELAERLDVSRQTVSKWENGEVCPDVAMLVRICDVFSCTLDELVRGQMIRNPELYTEPERVKVEGFSYLAYTVISRDPESDAIDRVRRMAQVRGIAQPRIIGWDFPNLSQEQINVYHMHGYCAALVLPEGAQEEEAIRQGAQNYVRITIHSPMQDPFVSIPNAYRILMDHIRINGYACPGENVLPCFEYEYEQDGEARMDVYIAVEG